MRILLLAQFYPPLIGGIERHVHSLGQALVARGHQVAVATLWHKNMPEYEEENGVRVYRVRGSMQRMNFLFTISNQHSPPFPDPEVTLALRKIVEQEKPDIIHAHNWIVYSYLPIKQWSHAKLLMTLHDCELACAQMRMMYRDTVPCSGPKFGKCMQCAAHHYGPIKGMITLTSNWLMSNIERSTVDLFLPVSNAIAAANQLTGSKTPYQVVPNFIPDNITDIIDAADPIMDKLPKEDFILDVGDLLPDKGINILLEAYIQLKNAPPLVLIGQRFALSPKSFPPNVTVFESISHKHVMMIRQRSLFSVVPSTCMDASPTVTLEAMAMGRAVIGSKIGGITDQIIDGETGFLVPPGDVDALRQSMESLIDNPELCQRMGTAAKQRAREFQASAVVSKIEKIYQSL
jgi:glycosyltransferase involved in cell wall biosynthesis